MKKYTIDVPGIGEFVFHRRSMRDQIRIEADQERLLGGESEGFSDGLRIISEAMATLVVLTDESPEGWSVEKADPLDPDTTQDLIKVWEAFRAEERRFRKETPDDGAGDRAGGVRSPEVPVAPAV